MENPDRTGQRQSGQRLTRKRIPVSCVSCRVRKLKCNREKPCQNCIVRGEIDADSCVYAEKAHRRSNNTSVRSDAENMRRRLDRLERSIMSMISMDEMEGLRNDIQPLPTLSTQPSENRSNDSPSRTVGPIVVLDTRSTHWNAIMAELGAMKEEWNEENDPADQIQTPVAEAKNHRPSLLSGLSPRVNRSIIVSSLPSEEVANKLIVRFFAFNNPMAPARCRKMSSIGGTTADDSRFSSPTYILKPNPSATSIAWIGLLFAVCCLAMQSYAPETDLPLEFAAKAPATSELYRVRTAECLFAVGLNNPVGRMLRLPLLKCEFMVEAVALHSFSEYLQERDGDLGTWLLSGTMVKLALQQGYHRDPSKHVGLSIFQGEMRRRVWTAVCQHEMLFSVQTGLPRSVHYSECDTEPLRNLYDYELYEEMTELPPSRPLTEETDIVYQAVKSRVMRAYGEVVELNHTLKPYPYTDVLKVDATLREARSAIPPHLILGTIEQMRNDPYWKILERYILMWLWHKATCILHRKFWDSKACGASPDVFGYSRQISVASAMSLLNIQDTMHQAARPGGILENSRWWDFSLMNHDFLLAAMIVSLDVMSDSSPDYPAGHCASLYARMEKMQAISKSRAIWAELQYHCRDAKRAAKILSTVADKLEARLHVKSMAQSQVPDISAPASNTVESLRQDPYFVDHFGLGEILPVAEQPPYTDTSMQNTFLESVDLEIPADFDWDAFDQLMNLQEQQNHQSDLAKEGFAY